MIVRNKIFEKKIPGWIEIPNAKQDDIIYLVKNDISMRKHIAGNVALCCSGFVFGFVFLVALPIYFSASSFVSCLGVFLLVFFGVILVEVRVAYQMKPLIEAQVELYRRGNGGE